MKRLVSSQLFKKVVSTACMALSFATFAVLEANSARAANLIQNGSFESGLEPGVPFSTLYAGSRVIDGWLVTQGSIDYISRYWENADGYRSLDLHGMSPGGIAQTFSTLVGQEYQVNFAIAGNPDASPFLKKMQVKAAGQSAYFSFDVSGKSRKSMEWQDISWKFTAVELQTTLEFLSLPTADLKPAYGITLDNVSVVAKSKKPVSVPEPGMLAGLFLFSVGAVLKKKATP